MTHADFVHLRVHTAFSLSEGAIKVKDLVDLCCRHDMPAVAITDTGNLFGALQFSMACIEAGVQPIIGCQLALRREQDGPRGIKAAPEYIVLLAQTETGYGNLMRLSSAAYLETEPGETPQIGIERLAVLSEGLIAIAAGPGGPVGRRLLERQKGAAEAMAKRLSEIFPGRFYVELMRHGMEAESVIEADLVEIAYRLDLPLVATNEVFFASADMFEAHDVLVCIAEGRRVSEADRRRLTPEHRFKSAAEMRALFADLPEAADNTLTIAKRCSFTPRPHKPMLPVVPKARERGEEATLRALAAEGLDRRLAAHAPVAPLATYTQRLNDELDVIVRTGFAGYFLIVADFIQWAKERRIPVGPGRGSGAASAVAWSLGITDLDPIRFGLLFERFLNAERVSMPDFDIDFCQDRRDEVIRYVQREYGADRVAQIITFGKLQARAALRDVGRVLEMPYSQVDRICKLVPNNPAKPVTLAEAVAGEPLLQQMRDSDEAVAKLIDIARKLEGLYRHASTHAAGVVVGDRPLQELVPLYRDPRSEMPVTQFNMKDVEIAGLVKLDMLGLKTLTVLSQAEALVRRQRPDFDVNSLPLDDAPTFAMLSRGETVGVFQMEGSGMRDTIRRLRPDRFEDLIALVALYRPGPMENIPKYIACKHGLEQPDYLHPLLKGILEETYGVITYQEQVMEIARVLSGYSLRSADLLRRAMGKKIMEEMEAQRRIFVAGAIERGVDEGTAAGIFEQASKFAGYGFNKPHAAAYALIAYQTAWLKANYPVEFLAASMTLELANTDKLNMFRQEADRRRVRLLPPDINASAATFAVASVKDSGEQGRGAILYALAAVRNVGRQAMESLVAERERGGRFADLNDFAQRLDAKALNRRQLEALARAGAFDALEPNRARVFAAIESVLRHANAAANERESNQANLFGGAVMPARTALTPAIADWPAHERLRHEFEAIGFYLSAHPLDSYVTALKRLSTMRAAEVPVHLAAGGNSRVKLAGVVVACQERNSQKGSRFAFLQLSDAGGVFEVTVFSDVLGSVRHLLEQGTLLLVTVEARLDGESLRMTANAIQLLEKAIEQSGAGISIQLADGGALPELRRAMEGHRNGRSRVSVIIDADAEHEVEITLPGAYAITAELRGIMQSLPGVTSLQDT